MENPETKWKISADQWRLFFVIFVLGLAGIFYVLLRENSLYDSAALYLGLPLLLALGLSLTPRAKSATGATMKGITIALLLSGIVLREGYICILFAAPIFYLVGALITWFIDRARKRKDTGSMIQAAAMASIIALLSLEGTTTLTSFPRHDEVAVSQIISASVESIRDQLAQEAVFDSQNTPVFLKIFPYPVQITGNGLNIGDQRKAHFIAYKQIWWNKVEGDLVMKVAESSDRHIKFQIETDDSYISHYLQWQSSEVLLEPLDKNHTKVTWKLAYTRKLDPSWYFGPLQNYAVKLSAKELIHHVASPRA